MQNKAVNYFRTGHGDGFKKIYLEDKGLKRKNGEQWSVNGDGFKKIYLEEKGLKRKNGEQWSVNGDEFKKKYLEEKGLKRILEGIV